MGRGRVGWWGRLRGVVGFGVVVSLIASGAQAVELPLPPFNGGVVANPSATMAAAGGLFAASGGGGFVDGSGGSAFELPLRAVSGRGGFGPALSLRYSSSGGRSLVGTGFSLAGASEIGRCARSIADDGVALGVRLDSSDVFCLDGHKLALVSGAYGGDGAEYRTLPDTNVRVRSFRAAGTPSAQRGPTSFTVWSPGGVVREYGGNGTAAAVAVRGVPGESARVSWSLERSRDRSGNVVVYSYGTTPVSASDSSEAERWLDKIQYGDGSVLDRQVKFDYVTRNDRRSVFVVGSARRSRQLLDKVTASALVGGVWKPAWKYSLAYQPSPVTGRSLLKSVTECGLSAGESCLRPTKFEWSAGGPVGYSSGQVQAVPAPSSRSAQVLTADFDGDGRSDVVWPETSAWRYGFSNGSGYPVLNNGDSISTSIGVQALAWPMDYDADGRTDLLPRVPGSSSWTPRRTLANRTVQRVQTDLLSSPMVQVPSAVTDAFTGDFDGDGYRDVLEAKSNGGFWTWSWRRRTGQVSSTIDVRSRSTHSLIRRRSR